MRGLSVSGWGECGGGKGRDTGLNPPRVAGGGADHDAAGVSSRGVRKEREELPVEKGEEQGRRRRRERE